MTAFPACSGHLGRRSAPLFLALLLATPLAAQAPIAAYPILPAGVDPIAVYDGQGHRVGRLLPQLRYWTPIERIPAFLQMALLAVEDANYYDHGGLDFRGIARALVTDAVKGRWAQGGSTITQQLIKNKFLTGERSLDRKVKAQGGALKLSNIGPNIYEVFAITKLNRFFDIKEDEADALAAF